MRTKISLTIAILLASVVSFAQNTSGFYFNPSLNAGVAFGNFSGEVNSIKPQLSLGYIWGNKNRHNLSVISTSEGLNRYYAHFGASLKYSYDVQLYGSKRMHLYLSPFASTTINLMKAKGEFGTNSNTRISNLKVLAGISPSFEYRLGPNTNFVFSLPINIAGYSSSHYKIIENTGTRSYNNNSLRLLPSVEANMGVRIMLFNKK